MSIISVVVVRLLECSYNLLKITE